MPVDIRQIINAVTTVVKSRANTICTASCDGAILKMHYRWTFCVFIGGFFTVWYQWYYRDVITCVSNYNAENQVRLDYINICLSYPYIEDGSTKRRYLLFYRWIHWSLLLLAAVYYIPRKVSKAMENKKATKLMEDLAANSFRYDQAEKELLDRAVRYVSFNLRTHNSLYMNFITVNIVALFIDIVTFQFFDFIFQGRFTQYGFQAYPFERDPKNYSDYMSQMFPPFASCELNKVTKLTSDRTENLGCHLTMMELYEKLFLAIWLWLIVLTAVTIGYITFLSAMFIPCFRVYLLRTAKPLHANDKVRKIIQKVSHNCKVGDVYLLYRLKEHLSHARFYDLLSKLSLPDELIKSGQNLSDNIEKEKQLAALKQQQLENLRNRKPAQENLPIAPGYHPQLNPTQHPQFNALQHPPQHPINQMHPNIGFNPQLAAQRGQMPPKANTSIALQK